MLWDVSMRLYHWLFAITLCLSYIAGDIDALDWHEKSGLTLLALLVYRLIWAFIGPAPARLTTMIQTVLLLPAYLRSDKQDNLPPGHNPLGVLSVLAFWAVAAIMVASGLFNYDDILYEGPLYAWQPSWGPVASKIHEIGHVLIIPLIALHLTALAWHQFAKRQVLIQRMTVGVPMPDGQAPSQAHQALGIVILTLSLSASWVLFA
jgi:cytochrome b